MKKASEYFPRNYLDARERFQSLVSAGSKDFVSGKWHIAGKTDKDLFVDYAYWPALKESETLIVLTSGIHGAETYAGSAIQQMFLQEILPLLNRKKMGVFIAHAMNPFGFKYHQRTTENGVNLNRNFSVSGELYKKKNLDSAKLHERFYAREAVSSMQSKLFQKLHTKNGMAFFDDVSLDEFIKATAPGQFFRPEDLEFGGSALEPQSAFLIEKMRELMPQYKDILALDLHTGLGHANRLHLLTSGSGEDLHPELFDKLFHPNEDESIYEHTPAATEGFYEVHGALNSVFVDLATTTQRVCAITMEYGTNGHSLEAQLEGLNSFIIAHQGQYYGFKTKELAKQSSEENFARSYPQTNEWKTAVIQTARTLFQNLIKRF